jgi:hypothetical protein
MSAGERLAHRREHVQPWVNEIRETCQMLLLEALPKSALGKAAPIRSHWCPAISAVFSIACSSSLSHHRNVIS